MILISRSTIGQNCLNYVVKYVNWTEWPELCGPHPTRIEGEEATPYLGSRLFRTSTINVSISDSLMCFSSNCLLLWSRAVIVSSANTLQPICFCMKEKCLAMYTCKHSNTLRKSTKESNQNDTKTQGYYL